MAYESHLPGNRIYSFFVSFSTKGRPMTKNPEKMAGVKGPPRFLAGSMPTEIQTDIHIYHLM